MLYLIAKYSNNISRILDDKVTQLETQLSYSTDLITQLKHDLQVKTDLLHLYTSDEIVTSSEDASPVHKVNVDRLQKRIDTLEKENRRLQEEANQVCQQLLRYWIYTVQIVKLAEKYV